MTCDHTVSYLDNGLLQSEVVEWVRNETSSSNRYNATMFSLTKNEKDHVVYKPTDFLDRRRGFMTIFRYCPDCGEKINWKAIKEELKR